MRKIELIGNVTKKPEMRTTSTGKDVCGFDVAVFVNSEKSDFYRISAFGKLGESCAKYLDKGRKVFVRGDLTPSIYNGTNGVRLNLDVFASEVEFLSPRETEAPAPKPQRNSDLPNGFTDINTDDLPF